MLKLQILRCRKTRQEVTLHTIHTANPAKATCLQEGEELSNRSDPCNTRRQCQKKALLLGREIPSKRLWLYHCWIRVSVVENRDQCYIAFQERKNEERMQQLEWSNSCQLLKLMRHTWLSCEVHYKGMSDRIWCGRESPRTLALGPTVELRELLYYVWILFRNIEGHIDGVFLIWQNHILAKKRLEFN